MGSRRRDGGGVRIIRAEVSHKGHDDKVWLWVEGIVYLRGLVRVEGLLYDNRQ
jgi:hypothetical protein